MATTALSFTASFGLSSLLWRHGLGYVGVESVIPIYIFISLGVDYNIFLPARIREESAGPACTAARTCCTCQADLARRR